MMPPWRSLALAAFLLESLVTAAPAPLVVPFNNTQGYGPDGPWHYISLPIGSPAQLVDFYPLLGHARSIIQASSSCGNGTTKCLDPLPGMYDTTLQKGANGSDHNGAWVDISDWKGSAVDGPNNYTGGGRVWAGQVNSPLEAQNLSFLLASNITAHAPGGSSYVPLSLLSLGANSGSQTKRDGAADGDSYLAQYAKNSSGASTSLGLHVGSPAHQQNATLVFGGYDQNRLIEAPAVFDIGSDMKLASLSVGTASGPSPFGGSANPPEDLLSGDISVDFDPSTPYINLPSSACDAMKEFLPISFDSSLGVYLWNTTSSSYETIVSSPTYLNFTFGDANKTSIRVPFALLNLTMAAPLVDQAVPYLPCSPVQNGSTKTFQLGRAFLQAAFLGASFDNDKLFVGQAAGPGQTSSNIVTFPVNGTFAAAANAPKWEDTWADVLTPAGRQGSLSGDNGQTDPTDANQQKNTGMSSSAMIGMIAGISVIAALSIFVAVYIFCLRRRDLAKPISINPAPVAFHDYETRSIASSNGGYFKEMEPGFPEKKSRIPKMLARISRIYVDGTHAERTPLSPAVETLPSYPPSLSAASSRAKGHQKCKSKGRVISVLMRQAASDDGRSEISDISSNLRSGPQSPILRSAAPSVAPRSPVMPKSPLAVEIMDSRHVSRISKQFGRMSWLHRGGN